jgi:hypothetical protein
MQKKGQFTLLVILGIVIVASVTMIVVFKDNLFSSQWETQRALSLSVPAEAEDLHNYIAECVREVIEEPVELMGLRGGYISLPSDPIGRGTHNPLSNTLEIFPDTDFETAYWYYKSANGVSKNQVPEIEDMENELAEYVNNNLASCADDFEIFEENNAEVGEIFTSVEILDDEVQFVIDYPITIDLEDFYFEFEKFYETVDVPLGELYQKSKEIMDTENTDFFLEELTYDMFVLNDEVPLADQEFDCEQKTWEYEQVEEDLRNIIMQNMLAVKIVGTKYDLSEPNDEAYYEWDALRSSTDYRANLYYSTTWPIELKVYPMEGGILEEDTYSGLSGPGAFLRDIFCLTEYQFIYDLKYPVLVTMYDPETDYTFQFATMVVLDNNQPRENEQGVIELGNVEETICKDASVPVTVYASTLTETGSFQDIEADITFKCISSVCPLGSTRDGEELETIVPACVNAQISAQADGYAKAVETVTSTSEFSVQLILEEYYDFTYDIVIVDADGNERKPGSDDTVVMTLVETVTGYTVTASHPENTGILTLAAGTYEITGSLINDAPFDIVIPESSYEKCTSLPMLSISGIFGLESDSSCVDVDVAKTEFSTAYSGNINVVWEVSRDELSDNKHVTLFVFSPGEAESKEELEDIYNFLELGLGQREPELK